MRFFLVRHGETPWTATRRYQGKTDVPLNAEGRRQARAIAKRLRTEKIDRLYTSTLKRASLTAREIARQTGLSPVPDRRLVEIDFGKWEGVSFKELAEEGRPEFLRWQRGTLRKIPGGESLTSLERRVNDFFHSLLENHGEETVAVISHGGPIKMFLFQALKMPPRSIWSFRIEPASISLLEGNRDLLQIVSVNDTSHLRKSS